MDNKLNKILKVLFAAELVLILLIIGLFSTENKEIPTAYAVKEKSNESKNFKIFTKAVCEEKNESVFCRDELFAKCGDKEYMINRNAYYTECGNIKLNLSEIAVNGSIILKKERI